MGIQNTPDTLQDMILTVGDNDDYILLDDPMADVVLEDSFSSESHHETYTGPYTVDPVFNEDVQLATNNRVMTDDVTVRQIKVTQSINPSGGRTVVIG